MFRILIFCSILVLSHNSSWAVSAPGDGQKQLLFDFRKEIPPGSKVPPDVEKKVLSKIFPKYLSSRKDCPSNLTLYSLADKRRAGLLAPDIASEAKGSFTAPGLSQTAYLIWAHECDATHAENWGSKRLVVMTGEQVTLNVEIPDADILKAVDINQDGTEELLMSRGWTGQGYIFENADIVGLKGGVVKTLHDFKMVYVDSCNASQNQTIRAAVLSVTVKGKGETPQFSQENFQAACPKGEEKPVFKPFQGSVGMGFD